MNVDSNQACATERSTEEVLDQLVVKARQFAYEGRNYDILTEAEKIHDEISLRAVLTLHDLGKTIRDRVVSDARFPGDEVVMLSSDNNGLRGFYPDFFGDTLVRHALTSGSSARSLEWLGKILNTKATTGKMMSLMWGVDVAETVQVTPNIVLCPFDAIPDGDTARWVRKCYESPHASLVATGLDWVMPSAVLVMDIKIACFAQRGPIAERSADEALEDNRFLNDVFILLPLAGPCAPVLTASWTTLDDPDLAFACGVEGRSRQRHEIFSLKPTSNVPIDVDSLKACHAGFISLANEDKMRVRTALKRLTQARLRHNLGDRAIELCIALESLAGDDGTNEITHKISSRIVRFIEGDLPTRSKNFKLIKSVYDLRSQMVHRGIINPKKIIEGLAPESAIDYVLELAGRFVRKILANHRFPNWKEFDIL